MTVSTPRPRRTVIRSAAVFAGTAVALLAASPAMALTRGDDPGPGLSALQTLGLFVGIPLGIVALITLFVYAPSIVAGASVRPGPTGPVQPLWFNGPTAQPGAPAEPGPSVERGAPAELGPSVEHEPGAAPASSARRSGGTSARW